MRWDRRVRPEAGDLHRRPPPERRAGRGPGPQRRAVPGARRAPGVPEGARRRGVRGRPGPDGPIRRRSGVRPAGAAVTGGPSTAHVRGRSRPLPRPFGARPSPGPCPPKRPPRGGPDGRWGDPNDPAAIGPARRRPGRSAGDQDECRMGPEAVGMRPAPMSWNSSRPTRPSATRRSGRRTPDSTGLRQGAHRRRPPEPGFVLVREGSRPPQERPAPGISRGPGAGPGGNLDQSARYVEKLLNAPDMGAGPAQPGWPAWSQRSKRT
jgi:hypothetical protein